MAIKLSSNDLLSLLGQRIRTVRKSLGLSQESLAERAELDRSYVGGVERGKRNISFVSLCKIADGLSVDVAYLTKEIPPQIKPC